ncbi:outer membrane protein assembly factor BamB [Prosthecobacter fusiformis]|uniref:Outer membrane protein assembly factor BamB n=1 Tax=Prosthecobacter fusiformis TaxID=48464 RepID=A0A4R7RIB7_9BACT|nr:PQQ-binding-like beta-propeller repeat protein [Prosthecobacter fusiformis]TDU62463.1 outer membrane protein assembly factor BamB [Prosthecobacter fusiformis]
MDSLKPDSSSPRKRRGLPWFPIVTVVIAAGAVFYVRSLPEFERNLKGWLSVGIPVLAALFILIWFLLTPRFSGRARLTGLVLILVAGFGLSQAVTVDGTVDGTGLPNLVWKGSVSGRRVEKITPTLATETAPVSADPRLAEAADVTQFFGPNRDGVITGAGLARDWKTNPPKELWRQPIGLGWSAYAVAQGRAYTQEQREEEELVTCYDLFTGKLIWAHADKTRFSQWQSGDGPHATPTLHEGRLYTYGGTGLLNCLEANTGKLVWQRSVLEENKLANNEWGTSASPLIVDDKVVITGGGTPGPVLYAYHRETGEPVWKAGDDQASYASPILATLVGKRVILSNNARAFTAYDPATGAVLLDHAWGGGNWPKASQPVLLSEDRVFLSAGYGMGCQMLEIKAGAGDALTATVLWTGLKMKTQFNSATVREGHAYGLDDGRLACLDLATGERLWKEGRFASGQTLLVDDLILIQSESGPVHLAAAKPEAFEELGKIQALSSKTWNHPTLAGRYLLVRNDREAVCYELPLAAE